MSNHGERVGKGIEIILKLAVVGVFITVAKLAWDHLLGPNLQIILTVLTGIAAFITVAYVVGYMATDLPGDIKEWWQ